ncbi:hypothetical protein NDU88_002219 [Pleurodeles waltl]|uniref:Uncharacterized protein n=1 Tax=Pleurodeles waltl TaxID=8319 RepID=A0AAV7TK52_PLEWA|nr:hypothetical protein NDU88_002219 [Pleurodeles waltl]
MVIGNPKQGCLNFKKEKPQGPAQSIPMADGHEMCVAGAVQVGGADAIKAELRAGFRVMDGRFDALAQRLDTD